MHELHAAIEAFDMVESSSDGSVYHAEPTDSDTECTTITNQSHQTRKRKRSGPEPLEEGLRERERKRKRPTLRVVEQYAELLNDMIDHARFERNQFDAHTSIQVGASLWTAQELDACFAALSRKGRHAIDALSSIVGTKSQTEVHGLLRLLKGTTFQREFYARRRKGLLDQSVVSAACEISPACEETLEVAADNLSKMLYQEEAERERSKHPRSWLLTQRTAKWVDRCLNAGEEGVKAVLDEIPAAHVLNVKTFLKLSKHCFMNSCDEACNWRTYKYRSHVSTRPSIFFTALSDFHTILIRVLKNLIQTALCFANSRLHAFKQSQRPPERQVRHADVLAAIKATGMKTDGKAFWTSMPRRCSLQVFENVRHKKVWGIQYSYDEVEDILSSGNKRGRYESRSSSRATAPSGSDSPDSSPESEFSAEEESTDGTESVSNDTASDASSAGSIETASSSASTVLDIAESSTIVKRQEQQQLEQDIFLEALDVRQSKAEEARLLQLLSNQNESPKDIDCGSIERPLPPERTRGDLTHWIDRAQFAAEWETFQSLPTADAFEL